jgi:Raf kinase inhibitor-like YbhB/YbcL family protein
MARPGNLQVRSEDLADGRVPIEFTCDGDNAVPTLSWSEGPRGTASFVVIAHDPDSPRGNFVHWLVWNIPGDRRAITAADDGSFEQGINDFGVVGWGGPCPPLEGAAHRYVFRVYALDRELEIDDDSHRDDLLAAMRGHILAQGELIASYERRKGRDSSMPTPVGP